MYPTYESRARRMGRTYRPSGRALVERHVAHSGREETCSMHIDTPSLLFIWIGADKV